MFAIVRALIHGSSIEELHQKTHIDPFFLEKIAHIVKVGQELTQTKTVEKKLLLNAKKCGFSDKQIARMRKEEESSIRTLRTTYDIRPTVNHIDTLGGEFPSETNYLYTTYHGIPNTLSNPHSGKEKVLVIGSGSYRIGSSVEFDWCSVSAIEALKSMGYETVILNFNPETVSTDFDTADILYFDEISVESILEIFRIEQPIGVIISMG